MGFPETLTIVLIVLKLIGIINWSWWLVVLPELVGFLIYLIFFLIGYRKTR